MAHTSLQNILEEILQTLWRSKFERVVLFEEKIKCIFVRNRLMRI